MNHFCLTRTIILFLTFSLTFLFTACNSNTSSNVLLATLGDSTQLQTTSKPVEKTPPPTYIPPTDSTNETIWQVIQKFDNDPVLRNASWGFYAKSVATGEVIAAHNAQKSLTPASTMKAITTATALAIVGPETTFDTQLTYSGKIDKEGVLKGNIYIIGSGDPTLGTTRKRVEGALRYNTILNKWMDAIKAKGITKIDGQIIGDARFFEEAIGGSKWLWEDLGNYYGVDAGGLNFHDNQFQIVFESGKTTGSGTQVVGLTPDIPELQVINRVKSGTVGSGDGAFVFGNAFDKAYQILGTVPPNQSDFSIKGAVPEPALFAAHALSERLKRNGIAVEKPATSIRNLQIAQQFRPTKQTTIGVFPSPTVKEIAYWTNKRSINIYAEALLKMIGKKKYTIGSRHQGLRAIKNFWKKRGINWNYATLYDGSGLSPVNTITPEQMVNVLVAMTDEPTFDDFLYTLPVAGDGGDDGFLKSFMANTNLAKKMHAKSGYMSNIRAYTGYVYTPTDDLIAYCIMVNHYSCTNGQVKSRIQRLLKCLGQ